MLKSRSFLIERKCAKGVNNILRHHQSVCENILSVKYDDCIGHRNPRFDLDPAQTDKVCKSEIAIYSPGRLSAMIDIPCYKLAAALAQSIFNLQCWMDSSPSPI